ncbi:LL-diaminopimelate aminotransferase [[Clostridium] polysaccharolyticum]|uniref:Aminotransferase n=1 Tax=[Clostridium] polysaccharolyticum TaxID=29364 RepID=A0A1I0G996_9FIRM|nr:LL-diaminopimelate aminotransferase [[Clostridium] polysaccharolyticum]SET66543.1 LL-diaminopimelate aminotransferase apoenzyme [[Clostridium] polysaccharolyticum]
MNLEFYQNLFAERIGGKEFGLKTELYKFAKIKLAKQNAKQKYPDVKLIDMGVGEPDAPADKAIVDVLCRESGLPENRFYSDNGILEFQEMACKYMEKVYGIGGLEPEKNIIHGIGSKPILAMMPALFINPGDISLMTKPGYGVLGTYTRYYGGEVFDLPLTEENDYYPDLTSIPEDVLKKAKILYINYPNNPTGQVATKEFFEKVVEFAKENEIMVVHDAAYAAVTFDGYKPLSIFTVEGAMDVAVEIHSLSKAFNMTGWRMAFIVGNERVIKAYGTVKDNTDSGQFRGIQKAGSYAINHPEITEKICEKYSRRFNLLVDVLNEVGFNVKKPKGTFYCYAKAPKKAGDVVFKDAQEASTYLIENALISTVPWDDAGAYLRFSVTFEATPEEEIEIMQEVKERLLKLNLKF